ncbi:3-keto-5-aminohexanoate cleavage protein [Acinetobacter pittii]|uniref:3-keto-5-aminohexanoate cleavage protein n=1 Tax=Acinetobacter pittii TaxID=48296 RepID=UPI001CD69387|nr:3-keto-5-aminohexanoate cleavage protein [Acinetobacter pittii]
MEKLIITAAVNGGITPRSKNPAVPYTPEEIANAVYEVWNAGASVAHIHARNLDGTPSYQQEVWGEIVDKVRARCDIILNLSTSGLNLPPDAPKDEAWNHLVYRPEIASYNCGSVNHGSKPFINPPALAMELADAINQYGVKPEIEIYHSGVINEAETLHLKGYLKSPMLFAFAMGIHGGVTATCKNLIHLIDSLPAGSLWSALGIGKAQLPINVHTILLGGHVRTGLEDNIYYKAGELATSNAQLVERLVRLSHELDRPVASTQEARKILGLVS